MGICIGTDTLYSPGPVLDRTIRSQREKMQGKVGHFINNGRNTSESIVIISSFVHMLSASKIVTPTSTTTTAEEEEEVVVVVEVIIFCIIIIITHTDCWFIYASLVYLSTGLSMHKS